MPFLANFILTHISVLVYTIGIGALLLNGLVIWLTSLFGEEIAVEGWAALILTPIGLAAMSTFLSTVLTINDDASYHRSCRKMSRKSNKVC